MHIAEIRTVAKSLPLLRLNTHKSLILSYSADFSVILYKNTGNRGNKNQATEETKSSQLRKSQKKAVSLHWHI